MKNLNNFILNGANYSLYDRFDADRKRPTWTKAAAWFAVAVVLLVIGFTYE